MKNTIILLISILFVSCVQETKVNNKENQDNILTKNISVVEKEVSDNDNLNTSNNTFNDSPIPLNLLVVSSDQLKVDGNQRYFLNDTLFTGLSRDYDGDQLIFEIQFKRGRKHGVSTFWHSNGQKKSILTFSNGVAKGDYKIWDKSGNIVKQGTN
tara:strand:- start:71 stop:535 length:465 start_codon:yes stop_codon:yes gene_type:complete